LSPFNGQGDYPLAWCGAELHKLSPHQKQAPLAPPLREQFIGERLPSLKATPRREDSRRGLF